MVNLLPAILIGGPPNAGKSVLFYSLTKTLHERGVRHHAIRACPDGEGNWYQEIHQVLDPEAIRLLRYNAKKGWNETFVNGICRDLKGRHLPLLVDMGGRPRDWQTCILQQCTHSLLLLRPEDKESTQFWHQLVESTSLLPLAQVYSQRSGLSTITDKVPVITGTIVGLERGSLASGPLFETLVERIANLFSSYSLEELERAKLDLAPVELVVNLDPLLRRLDPQAKEWRPDLLPQLVDELPLNTPLAVYGRGPGWLYGTLAAHVNQQVFYQFDPRIGWVAPPTLRVSAELQSEELSVALKEHHDALVLTVSIHNDYLDHLQTDQLPFPIVPSEYGLILDGRIPHWLLTALVRLYQRVGVAWIACHQPILKAAVVVTSRVSTHRLSELIPMPAPEKTT